MIKPADSSSRCFTDMLSTGVVFSLTGDYVWASWPGTEVSVNLGRHEPVSAMMQDFLDQNELGERIGRNARRLKPGCGA